MADYESMRLCAHKNEAQADQSTTLELVILKKYVVTIRIIYLNNVTTIHIVSNFGDDTHFQPILKAGRFAVYQYPINYFPF